MSEDQFVVNDPDFNIDYTKHSGEAVVQVFLPSNRFITLMETELRPFVNIFSTNGKNVLCTNGFDFPCSYLDGLWD